MDWIMPLIAGLGIGSLLKTVIDHFILRKFSIKNRLYEEKKEAYIGLLNSLHIAAVEHSDKNAKQYAFWQTKCEVFGSDEVTLYAQKMVETNDDKAERSKAFRGLISAIRKDLRE